MAEDQEPTLPPLSAISRRKRARIDGSSAHDAAHFATSSDPAFFSSDDDPSVDNYTAHRKKKRYVGSWFQQHPAAASSSELISVLPVLSRNGGGNGDDCDGGCASRPRRTFERQFDSGVWMGSDATDDSIIEELELPVHSRLPLPVVTPARGAARVTAASDAEMAAQAKIRECIEAGEENIDLSSMGLSTLSNATVSALSEFSCIPTVEKGVPFVQQDPSLKLFLSGNGLTRAPGAIFDLEHLTVLSLRNNGLRELPPAVARLRGLRSLNVSLNALRSLPVELLELVAATDRLTILQMHPNPFYQPRRDDVPALEDAPEEDDSPRRGESEDPTADGQPPEAPQQTWLRFTGRYRGELLARTPVEFSDTTGRVYSDFRFPADDDATDAQLLLPTEDLRAEPSPPSTAPYLSKSALSSSLLPPPGGGGRGPRHTRVPTLLELALRSCYRAQHLAQLPAYLPEHAPPHLHELLGRAAALREAGGAACSVCGRFVVKPRAEWVEWWDVRQPSSPGAGEAGAEGGFESLSRNEDERAVPFVRRGCSWRCVPQGVGSGV